MMTSPSYTDHYENRFEHKIVLPTRGIISTTLEWTYDNMEGDWGWYHENDLGVMTFEKPFDAMIWKIKWWDYYTQRAMEESDSDPWLRDWEC